MIIINDNKYNKITCNINVGDYQCVKNGIKYTGSSPTFEFYIDNNIIISLETIYDLSLLDELKVNDNNDITTYITDICYKDNKGWTSLITSGKCNCLLTKILKGEYMIRFDYISDDSNDNIYKIKINEMIY